MGFKSYKTLPEWNPRLEFLCRGRPVARARLDRWLWRRKDRRSETFWVLFFVFILSETFLIVLTFEYFQRNKYDVILILFDFCILLETYLII